MKILLVPLLMFIFIIGCKKNDYTNEKSLAKVNIESNDFIYLKNQLKNLALVLKNEIASSSGRNNIVNKAKLKFDEESEVLIKDLQVSNQNVMDQLLKIQTDIQERSNTKIYPQIYIPKYQDYENLYRNNNLDTVQEPVLVFYSGNAEVDSSHNETLPGYKFINGSLVFSVMVDEAFANQNEVWIFSINESVEETGSYRLPNPCELLPIDDPNHCGGSGGGIGGGGGGVDDDPVDAPNPRILYPETGRLFVNCKIENMKVANPKESWISGKSEICIRAKLTCHNGRTLGIPQFLLSAAAQYTSDQYSNYLGCMIRKFSRKEVKNQTTINVNYSLQKEWQAEIPNRDPIYFDYVIFERDPWPAKLNKRNHYGRYSSISPNDGGPDWPQWFRSSDNYQPYGNTPYVTGHFCNNLFVISTALEYGGTGLVSNNEIKFNTKFY